MLGPNRETALALLDQLLVEVEYARANDGNLWWPIVLSALHSLERHPLTGDHLRAAPPDMEHEPPLNPISATRDPVSWGRRAYAAIARARTERKGAGMRTAPPHPESYSIHSIIDGHSGGTYIGQANGLFIRPLVAWLRAEVLATVPIEYAIERWIQRAELFGIGRAEPDEATLQDDLHRFLFDTGLEPYRGFDRELTAGYGRVDFVLRGEEPVPVELKLWRGGARPGIDAWTYQARTYGADMRARRAYLVVANASERERLEPAGTLASGEPLPLRGMEVHVRFVDLGRHAPSKDHNARQARPVSVNDLLLGIEPESR